MPGKRRLTEVEWSQVFDVRCRSKRGESTTAREQRLVNKAFEEDRARYAAMEADVFDATVPFGSNVKWKR